MKKITLTLTAIVLILCNTYGQISEKQKAEHYLSTQGELTFTFQVDDESQIDGLTTDLSLVHYDPVTKTVKAWANIKQFRRFEEKGIPFLVPANENGADASEIYDVRPLAYRSATPSTLTFPLNTYPSYAEYAQQMQDFQTQYPNLVQTFSIGTTTEGDKELWFVKISDNVSVDEAEPKLMYTSTMHGDETAGYPMMLTLIDYILTVYNDPSHSDYARVQNLVENSELWINPNANPDGTYHNDPTNTSVAGARRANANNIDLNRNYPDNVAGPNSDGNAYQVETIAFMNLAVANKFVISANFHGGTELVNYPFDNAYASTTSHPEDPGNNGPFYTHADGDWFEYISVEYATNCQADAVAGNTSTPNYSNKASYMTDDEDSYIYPSPGVTHGAEWYRVYGGRQDFMNVTHHCREVTIELSDQKILQESSLDDYWFYNRDALLDYLTQGTYGYRGIVEDANTSQPIEDVKVTIVGHDAYGSEVYTDTAGDYYRPIKGGTYSLLFEAPCYQPYTISNENILDYQTKVLPTVSLTPVTNVPTGLAASNVSTTVATISWDDASVVSYDLRYREVGQTSWTNINVSDITYQLTGLTELTEYEVQVRSNCGSFSSNYSSSITFTTTDVIPCTGTPISSFPYQETFDSGIGDWSQGSGDDGNWTILSGQTPSNNTGPTDDISGGGSYFYTEASNGGIGSNATVYLESPCFDLTNETSGEFSFNYHMRGNNLGTLVLEASTDDGSTWLNLFSQSGNQGNQWNFQAIDISAYYGQVVKLRFVGTTGNGWSSDIAVDQVRIGEPIITYCDANGNNTNDEFINRVQLNTLNNNNSGTGTTSTGYSDFTENTSLTTDLFLGTQYTITITPQWTGQQFNEGYSVWIDYNRDGDFTDSGEQIFSQAPTQNSPVSGAFTIPTGLDFGPTRMRVALSYDAIPSSCGAFGYGEVEDYTVNIAYDGLLYTNNSWTPNAPSDTTTSESVLVMDGVYNVASDISINDLTINSGAEINVNKNASVSVVQNVTNNGEFVLNSDSDEFAGLIVEGTVSGNVKYNRHVTSNAGGNDIITPPVSGETFTSFISNNPNIFSNSAQTMFLFGPFEKPLNDYTLYSNTETVTLDAAKGYRAASTDDGTFTFDGTVTTGTISVPIVKIGTEFEKWNLIGNPYTSYVRLSDFLIENLTDLDPQSVAIYGYDADDSDGSVWTIWNMAYSDANPNSLIAPGQGFFVSSLEGGSSVTFTSAMQTTGSGDDFIQGRLSDMAHFVITMNSAIKQSNTDIYFKQNATLGLDIGYDAELFEGEAPSMFKIYSELNENGMPLNMAIQSIGFDDINGSTLIPLGVNLLQGQQVSISMNTTDLDYDVYLEDTATNTTTLLNDSDYTFMTNTELLGTGRFFLRFEAETLSNEDPFLETLNVFNDANKKQIVVQGQLNEETTLVLYDIQGREILRTLLEETRMINTIDTTSYTNGVYLVQLTDTGGSVSKKIIIR